MTTSTLFFCNTCDDPMTHDSGICSVCDNHFRALEAAVVEPVRRCGCNVQLPADRTVCDSCAPYSDH